MKRTARVRPDDCRIARLPVRSVARAPEIASTKSGRVQRVDAHIRIFDSSAVGPEHDPLHLAPRSRQHQTDVHECAHTPRQPSERTRGEARSHGGQTHPLPMLLHAMDAKAPVGSASCDRMPGVERVQLREPDLRVGNRYTVDVLDDALDVEAGLDAHRESRLLARVDLRTGRDSAVERDVHGSSVNLVQEERAIVTRARMLPSEDVVAVTHRRDACADVRRGAAIVPFDSDSKGSVGVGRRHGLGHDGGVGDSGRPCVLRRSGNSGRRLRNWR